MIELNTDNYYSTKANLAYFSVSQIKQFLDCPARAMAELRGEYEREKTTSLLVGGYVDAYFSGDINLFVLLNPQLFTLKGEIRAEYKHAHKIIDCIKDDPLAVMLMDGERQKIVTAEIGGFPFKCKLDFLLNREQFAKITEQYPGIVYEESALFADGAIVDLKIVKDFEDKYAQEQGRISWVDYWMYDLQMAVYREAVRKQTGKTLPCYILAFTKEKVPDRAIKQVPSHAMDIALELMIDKLPEIAAIKSGKVEPERCGRCDYCKATKRLTGATWFDFE